MRKILVVEDEDILRETYLTILSTEPYLVDVASNGEEALIKCQDTSYDLVLLDLMMPIMNGVDFLKHAPVATTKIIIMSNLSSGDLLTQAIELGAYKSVLKSDLSPKQLLALVRYEVRS
ncbi:MAG: DNA-binding response regulator VicR [Candidatus Saccharibacteria bacterium]|nr:DNA-binding response regulator VicR [Candidatus Saccharibacteria bacterium]